jgi:hypothetical protein
MSRGLVALVTLLVVTSLAAGVGAGTPEEFGLSAAQQEFDRVEFHVTVYGNGSARWTFRYGSELTNESEVEQFESYANEFENESTPLYEDFQSKGDALTAQGSNVTGRDMAARDFSKRAYTRGLASTNKLGVVEMSFRWTNFAAMGGDTLVVGDVFDGGLYVGANQQFVVAAGDGLDVQSADPEPDTTTDDSVTWRGDREFADERPRVVFAPKSTATTTTTSANTDPTDTTTNSSVGPDSRTTIPWLVITGVAALLVIGAVFAWQRVGDRFGGGATDADDGGSPNPEPAIPDEEMITDEERVLGLLRDNGGRMRQVNIVEETGWSKSKVSMLLSEMEEEEQVTKLRVGRENIVSLPGEEPDASGSPYDDE